MNTSWDGTCSHVILVSNCFQRFILVKQDPRLSQISGYKWWQRV